MESSSDAAMGKEEDSTCDPSPPPPPSAPPSSKRRWSPCTWRYAIEEAQAELPSRSRSTSIAAALPSSSRPGPLQNHQQPIKTKPLPPHLSPSFCKPAGSAHPGSSHHMTSRPPTELRMGHSVHASSKGHVAEQAKKSLHPEFLSGQARVSEKEEEENDDADQDDGSNDGDYADGGDVLFDEEYFKRRRREMSPRELYFCAYCSASKGITKCLNGQS